MSRDPGWVTPRRTSLLSWATIAPIVLSLGLGGCAAGRAGLQIQDAIEARDAALSEGADEAAPYEYTMARRYLEKAWEEMGYSEYKMSVLLARKSAEWSDQAIVQMQRGTRVIDVDLFDGERFARLPQYCCSHRSPGVGSLYRPFRTGCVRSEHDTARPRAVPGPPLAARLPAQ